MIVTIQPTVWMSTADEFALTARARIRPTAIR